MGLLPLPIACPIDIAPSSTPLFILTVRPARTVASVIHAGRDESAARLHALVLAHFHDERVHRHERIAQTTQALFISSSFPEHIPDPASIRAFPGRFRRS
jgi:hypothetical protein